MRLIVIYLGINNPIDVVHRGVVGIPNTAIVKSAAQTVRGSAPTNFVNISCIVEKFRSACVYISCINDSCNALVFRKSLTKIAC